MAQKIISFPLPSLRDIYRSRCQSKAYRIIKDATHPIHHIFSLLPSGRHYRALKCHTARLRISFYPSAIHEMNSYSPIPLPITSTI